jgi:hypothetical protein
MRNFTRSKPSAAVEQAAPTCEAPNTDPVIMRFLTVGGATVELRTKRFATRTHPSKGRPYVVDEPYAVDGYGWYCLGCDANSNGETIWDEQGYLPNRQRDARNGANAHASECRALPKPEVTR